MKGGKTAPTPDNEKKIEEADQIFAGLWREVKTASDFYEREFLPAIREEGSDMAPDRLRELIVKYEEEHPGKKIDPLALISVAIASIGRSELEIILPGEDPNIERRWQAGRVIQQAFDIPEEIFQRKIKEFQNFVTRELPPDLSQYLL